MDYMNNFYFIHTLLFSQKTPGAREKTEPILLSFKKKNNYIKYLKIGVFITHTGAHDLYEQLLFYSYPTFF